MSADHMNQMRDEVRKWLDIIDRLRAVGIEKDITIPQIAVMGDQSSGKSSVLEALSGVHFPRGSGLVTKCATELRMKNKSDSPWAAKISLNWNSPQPTDAGEVNSPEDLGAKISKLTEILLLARGKNATFESEHSILIELTSPDVPDLTIIDLPGIVRTTLEGQSKSVVSEVDSLLQKYLDQDRTVILAVVPSNVDMATVDIIERASMADPQGNRTLGVLTKPDMIGEGSEIEKVDILNNLIKPLKLGYVMVKNRSQRQIDEGISLQENKELEMTWFRTHKHFGSMDTSLFGVDNLAKKLTNVLVDRIKDSMPQLQKEVSNLLESTTQDLELMGESPPETAEDSRLAVLNIVQKVSEDIRKSLQGEYDTDLLNRSPRLRIYARFRTLTQHFNTTILEDIPRWTTDDIKGIVSDMRGRELPGFPKPEVFQFLVGEHVQRWRVESHKLLQKTHELLVQVSEEIVDHHIPRYKKLASGIKTKLIEIATNSHTHAKKVSMEQLLGNETIPMTMNHYFMDIYNKTRMEAFEQALDRCFSNASRHASSSEYSNILKNEINRVFREMYTIGAQTNEDQEAKDLHAILQAYWKTSSKRFIDTAIQTVDSCLLRQLHELIVGSLHRLADIGEGTRDLFAEDYSTKERRKRLEARVARLRLAHDQLLLATGASSH